MDKAFIDAGYTVIPGCEIDPEMREMYQHLCGGEHLTHDLADLPDILRGQKFDGVIGGPPCQAHSKLRAIKKPKFADLTELVWDLMQAIQWDWCLFENVRPIELPGLTCVRLNAMHYHKPHQSRARWFSHSAGLSFPPRLYQGSVDDLMAYSVVAGRIYGPKRGAVLQGYKGVADMPFPCVMLQKGLANAVPYPLAQAWANSIRESRSAA